MKSEYDKTIQILQELEEGDRKDGLFGCFGLTPHGEILYFDGVGSPYRVRLKGSGLYQGALVHLGKMPVEVVSRDEAYRHLAEQTRLGYLAQWQAKQAVHQNKRTESKQQRRLVIASAGLIILLAFLALVFSNSGDVPESLRQAETRLKDLYSERGVSIDGYKDVPMVVQPGSYNPLGPVSISFEVFQAFLNEMDSPAAPEAAALYAACLEEGCDPALALAFFEHESSGGKRGVAAYTKSLGNIRCTSGYECFTTEGNGSFRRYKTWADGLRDWAELLRFYKNDWKRVTLEDIIPKYAPQSDNNNEAAYISKVKERVDNLRGRETGLTAAKSGELPVGNPVYESDMVITQGFSAKHPAIDIARPASVSTGTSIHTTISGVVTVVRDDPVWGNRVFVSNSQFTAHYNHLTDDVGVKTGQVVKRGDVIGLMGNTGKSTGPHLDYELFQGKQRLNPLDWVYRK